MHTLLLLCLHIPPSLAQDTELVPMRDGVRLATDVYLPTGSGPWPTILFRTPYGREEFQDDAAGYTPFGVAVVSQDMRGRYDSEGTDTVFLSDGDGELSDGADTCSWILDQSWSDGLIGTTGGSARGIVQYMQTSADPPGLVVINPSVATPNLYQDAMFHGGAFRQALVEGWLEGQGSLDFLDEVAEHPYEDAFWDPVQTADAYAQVAAAGLHEGGWYDIFSQGNLDGFAGYQEQGAEGARGEQKLVIGPWTHGGMYGRSQGELRYPESAETPPWPDAFATLFIHHLQLDIPGWEELPADIPAVQYYVMGATDDKDAPGNEWRSADSWPPTAAPVRLHLQTGGLLDEACPSEEGGSSSYAHDPANPVPTICGANLNLEAGPCDQRAVEERDDVLVFSTQTLSEPMEVTGRVRARLWVEIDQADADVMVRLSDVYPDGRSMLITDGAARLAARGSHTGIEPLQPGELLQAEVDLWSTSIIVDQGHQLRISISSSNSPRYAVNQGNGLDWPEYASGEGEPVEVRIHHSAAYPSYVELPDPDRDPADYNDCDGQADTGEPDSADSGASGQPDDSGIPVAAGGGGCGCGGAVRPGVLLGLLGLLGIVCRRRGCLTA